MNLHDVAPADDVTGPWWDATREHRLVLQGCSACGAVQHPPRAICTTCHRTDSLGLRHASGEGTVDACTTVFRGPRVDVAVPYVVARVRLDEGPILLTNLVGDAPSGIGDRVRVDWIDLPDGRALPVFVNPGADR